MRPVQSFAPTFDEFSASSGARDGTPRNRQLLSVHGRRPSYMTRRRSQTLFEPNTHILLNFPSLLHPIRTSLSAQLDVPC